ncbi:hypothetical protein [Mucilaginibacter sp. UYCu711]|uniref:hypothetical protein n=1 Tax=Mucilaginibacter sp. UYCu711 TaxID=3156339 RepID=UPI003D20F953
MTDTHKEKFDKFLNELKSGKAIVVTEDDPYNIYDFIDEHLEANISKNKVLQQIRPGSLLTRTISTILIFYKAILRKI